MRYSFVSLYFDTIRLACESSVVIGLRMMTFAAGGAKADCVWVRGRKMVEGGRHMRRDGIVRRFRAAMKALAAS